MPFSSGQWPQECEQKDISNGWIVIMQSFESLKGRHSNTTSIDANIIVSMIGTVQM